MANYPQEVTIEYSPAFKKQTTFGTALNANLLTKSIRANVKAIAPQHAEKLFRDCSTEFLQSKITLAKWGTIDLEFEATPQLAGGWAAFAMGQDSSSGTDPLTHQENMITGRDLPVTTLRIGFNDGVDVGWIVKDVAVNSISFSARAGFDSTISCAVSLITGDWTAGASTSWAACYSTVPSTLFSAAGSLVINGTDYWTAPSTFRGVSCALSNNIPIEAGFAGGSISPTRWVRAGVRGYTFAVQLDGSDTSANALATLCRANNLAGTSVANTLWKFGTSGNTFAVNIPAGILSYAGTPQGFLPESQGETGVLNLQVQGIKESAGGATEPLNFTAVIPTSEQAAAYLVAA